MLGFIGKFWNLVRHPTHSRTTMILLALILLAAVPLTVIVSQQQQETRQRASGNLIDEICDPEKADYDTSEKNDLRISYYESCYEGYCKTFIDKDKNKSICRPKLASPAPVQPLAENSPATPTPAPAATVACNPDDPTDSTCVATPQPTPTPQPSPTPASNLDCYVSNPCVKGYPEYNLQVNKSECVYKPTNAGDGCERNSTAPYDWIKFCDSTGMCAAPTQPPAQPTQQAPAETTTNTTTSNSGGTGGTATKGLCIYKSNVDELKNKYYSSSKTTLQQVNALAMSYRLDTNACKGQ